MEEENREVVVVGGGIAGLVAAHTLTGRDVVVFESDSRAGGRIWTQRRQPYWMSVGAHIVGDASSPSPMAQLAVELGLKLAPLHGDMAAVWSNGHLTRTGTPELLPLRLSLPPAGRMSLAMTGVKVRRIYKRALAAAPGAIHGARDFEGNYPTVIGDADLDEESFERLLGPMHPSVAAIFRTAVNRVAAEPHEMSGHFGGLLIGSLWTTKRRAQTVAGGVGEITNRLAERLGHRLVTGAVVRAIIPNEKGAEVHVEQGGALRRVKARFVVCAAPAYVAREIIHDLPQDKAEALATVRYGPYVVMAATTRETGPMPYDDIYAVAVSGRTLSMLYNTVNALRGQGPRTPGGSFQMFAGGDRAAALMSASDAEIRERLLSDVYAVYPETRGLIDETWIRRLPRGFPFWEPGRLRRQPALARPHKTVYFAGDWIEYPSTNTAARSAQIAARAILRRLDAKV